MTEQCVLLDRQCTDCGDCERCDLDDVKICDSCGRCIDQGEEYRSVKVKEFGKGLEKKEG